MCCELKVLYTIVIASPRITTLHFQNLTFNSQTSQPRRLDFYASFFKYLFRMQLTLVTIASIVLTATALPTWTVTKTATVPNVRIQLNGISGEDATQHEVPADNSAFSLNTVSDIFSASIIDSEGLRFPSCRVFSDLKGLEIASEISFTAGGDTVLLLGSFGTVKVGSVRCSHQ
jgi:hypothetical protein